MINKIQTNIMDEACELYNKAKVAFTHGQCVETATYYIDAAKKGHPDCIRILSYLNNNWKELDNEVLFNLILNYFKQESENSQKNKPIIQHWEESAIDPVFSECDIGPIGACTSDYEDGPIEDCFFDNDY